MTGTSPFGQLLRQHRLLAALSQEALAERAGLSADAIRALERGRRTTPRPETVALLADSLFLSPADRVAFIAAAAERALAQGDRRLATPAHPPIPLPEPPTALIGRQRDATEITQLLQREGVRIVTLTGPGGVGKTRLALAVAHSLRSAFPDGVAFADLSALRDPLTVGTTVARALGLREDGARGPRDLLVEFLSDKRMLLVLDNFEQVIEAAPLLADLAATTSRLVMLVTSRTPLRLRAEHRYPVPPLESPESVAVSPQEVAEYSATRLFTERAEAALPTFRLSTENAQIVVAICRRLDGLPLAIELAAARIALLPPHALLTRLDHRLAVLTRGARDLPKRQQTLRATIDWSYALLSESERTVFRRLSVFAGGSTADAAEEIAESLDGPHGDTLSEIAALVDHNLLRSSVQADGEPRFWMLETVREYGLEQLTFAGEEESARRNHAAYFVALAETATLEQVYSVNQARLMEQLEREHDNLRAALAWAYTRDDADLGLRMVSRLWRFWYIRGHLSEGRDWLQNFLALPAATTAGKAYVEALVGLANLAYVQADYDAATAVATRSLAAARVLNDQINLAYSLNILAAVARHRSDFARAASLWDECLPLLRPIEDDWLRAIVLHNFADVTRLQGEYDRAAELAEQSLALARRQGEKWGQVQAALILGEVARDRGHADQAVTWFELALVTSRPLNHERDIALALAGLAEVALARGDHGTATALVEESLGLLRPLGDKLRLAHVLNILGRICRLEDDDGQAIEVYLESLSLSQQVGNRLGLVEALEGIAAVSAAATSEVPSQAQRAVRILAAASALRDAIGAPLTPAGQDRYLRDVAQVRKVLDRPAFNAAWTAGETTSPETLITDLLANMDASLTGPDLACS